MIQCTRLTIALFGAHETNKKAPLDMTSGAFYGWGEEVSVEPVNHPNFVLVLHRGPRLFQRLQNITDEILVSRGFLADIALAATVHLQSGEQVLVVLVELRFISMRRQAVDMHLARFADPQN